MRFSSLVMSVNARYYCVQKTLQNTDNAINENIACLLSKYIAQ